MLCFLLPLSASAQIHFEKGYFIDGKGQRTECLIRNRGWNNNPSAFSYKLSETDAEKERTLANTSEFSIYEKVKFAKAEVEMERSTNRTGNLSKMLSLDFAKEIHFLRVLVEGNATLYIYEEGGLTKFFHKNAKGKIEQLVYVRYLKDNTDVREYNQYQTQLDASTKCEGTTLETLRKLKYDEASLVAYFRDANNCSGLGKPSTFEPKKGKAKFHLRPVIGVKSMKLDLKHPSTQRYDIDTKKTDLAYGLELEYVLATNRNKWSFFIEANYNKIEEEIDLEDPLGGTTDERAVLKFSSVQVPVGARYYSFLNDDFKIFADAMLVMNAVSSGSRVTYVTNKGFSMEGFNYNFGAGIGLSYKKINAEMRYYAPQSLVQNVGGDFKKISFTLSYAVF